MADLIAHRLIGLRNQTFDMFVSIQGYLALKSSVTFIRLKFLEKCLQLKDSVCQWISYHIQGMSHLLSSNVPLNVSWAYLAHGQMVIYLFKYGNSFVLIMLLLY